MVCLSTASACVLVSPFGILRKVETPKQLFKSPVWALAFRKRVCCDFLPHTTQPSFDLFTLFYAFEVRKEKTNDNNTKQTLCCVSRHRQVFTAITRKAGACQRIPSWKDSWLSMRRQNACLLCRIIIVVDNYQSSLSRPFVSWLFYAAKGLVIIVHEGKLNATLFAHFKN